MALVRSFLALASLLAIVVLVHAQGFINIDCGLGPESGYTDQDTGIIYLDDGGFIATGKDMNIKAPRPSGHPKLYLNVRSFPNGTRNCYKLSGEISKGNKYLIRAYFMYGNYDGKNSTPKFDLYIGVNLWSTISFSGPSDAFDKEIITVATINFISVCLVDTGSGTPFISALELRPLNDSMYAAANESQSLVYWERSDTGLSSGSADTRYPMDPFDRIWKPSVENVNWSPINSSANVTNPNEAFQPPSTIMNTAVTPVNSTAPLDYFWRPSDSTLQFKVYMFFAELERIDSTSMTREFTVCCGNDTSCYGEPIRPRYLVTDTIQTVQPLSGQDEYSCSFTRTPRSTLPPILNAIEIFTILQLPTTPTKVQDVEAIYGIKDRYRRGGIWMNGADPCVPKDYSWQGLTCNYPLSSDAPTIVSLNLSSAGLSGEIPASLGNLTSIQTLDVSNNGLTGPVPNFLAELPFLKFLNLSNNDLTGTIPSVLQERSKNGSLSLSIENNPNLNFSSVVNDNNGTNPCQGGSCKKRPNIVVPVLASVIPTLILLTIAVFVLRRVTKSRRQRGRIVKTSKDFGLSQNNRYKSGFLLSENRRFTYAEVVSITNNFERSIGKGGFGIVYHGQLRDGTQVAVKMLSQQSVMSLSHPCQGSNEFQNEAQLLLRVHHRNLVPFIGYCQEGDNMALIYEYMAQGNLGSHLSGSGSNALSWGQRLRIAVDVAQGLEYLHNDCKPPIIHRDVKTANILLNERLEAKIGDFGLSKVFSDDFTHVSTAIKGTFGYLDPEYYNSTNLTEKSDVYSFGVVLLQLITGQPAIIRISNSERRSLIDWLSPVVEAGDIKDVVDPRLEGEYDINFVQKALEIALTCTRQRSMERPPMRDVVVELRECLGIEKALESRRSLRIEPVETYSADFSCLSPR